MDTGTEWKTKQGAYIGSFVMVEDCLSPLGRPPTESCITELLTKPCSKLEFARFTKQMFKFDTAMVRLKKSFLRIIVWHHEACRVMTNGDPEGQIILSYPHTNNGFFFLLTTVFLFLNKLPEAPEYAKMQFDVMTSL